MYKRYLYEGGIRVPLIARWPGTIPAGSTTDQWTTQYDLMPTLADAGGMKKTDEMDGISILPTLRNQPKSRKSENIFTGNSMNAPSNRLFTSTTGRHTDSMGSMEKLSCMTYRKMSLKKTMSLPNTRKS